MKRIDDSLVNLSRHSILLSPDIFSAIKYYLTGIGTVLTNSEKKFREGSVNSEKVADIIGASAPIIGTFSSVAGVATSVLSMLVPAIVPSVGKVLEEYRLKVALSACGPYTGCRITEALELTASRIDIEAGQIVFESLKKRRRGLYRAVPVPEAVIEALDLVHGLREAQKGRDGGRGARLWEFSRTSAWRYVAAVLDEAGVRGPQASPKGLRHGFGVQAVSSGVPLNMVQKWLGHAQLSTTAIYADAVGAEEQGIMLRMWAG